MDPDSSRLQIAVTDGRGRPVRAPGLRQWLEAVAPARARGSLALALASDAEVRALNRHYRRVDEPTDVLSFPSEAPVASRSLKPEARSLESAPRSLKPEARSLKPEARSLQSGPRSLKPEARSLGDLIIATGVARRQAAQAGHSYATELKVLALHGLLHLLGYDHHASDDAGRMARVEARLRRKGGLPAGLIERAAPAARAHRVPR